jgi:hypothetical protein
VVSPNFCRPGAALTLGNELLSDADPTYAIGHVSKLRIQAHTEERVLRTLENRNPSLPLGGPGQDRLQTQLMFLLDILCLTHSSEILTGTTRIGESFVCGSNGAPCPHVRSRLKPWMPFIGREPGLEARGPFGDGFTQEKKFAWRGSAIYTLYGDSRRAT